MNGHKDGQTDRRTDGQIDPWTQQRLPQSRRADCLDAEVPAANIAEEPVAHIAELAEGVVLQPRPRTELRVIV